MIVVFGIRNLVSLGSLHAVLDLLFRWCEGGWRRFVDDQEVRMVIRNGCIEIIVRDCNLSGILLLRMVITKIGRIVIKIVAAGRLRKFQGASSFLLPLNHLRV